MNSIRNAKQAAQAKAVLSWLFATDKAGHRYANARRLGVMYIIWNNKIWGAYNVGQGWRAYSSCASHPSTSWDTTCHRNHMHISLSWEGSQARSSFWTKKVAATDYGPCRAADLNWARPYHGLRTTRCPGYPAVKAPAGSSALMKSLVKYSGMDLRKGATGPAVSVVQQAVKAPVTGRFDARTVAIMKAWKQARNLGTAAAVTPVTWRALLKANAPKTTKS
jgi:peptidoglycan hydrolase-like protein with peptidoglycan-binding domain